MLSTYRELQPSGRLAAYVECYWHLDVRSRIPAHRVLPDGCVDILFSKTESGRGGLTVVGLMTTPLELSLTPGQSFFGVRFRPAMASAFIPGAAVLRDQEESLDSFWGAKATALLQTLGECQCATSMATTLEDYLRPDKPAELFDRIALQISSRSTSSLSIVAQHELSARHLRRLCKDLTGVSPKLLSRILRFRHAAERIAALGHERTQPDWASFALTCGFFDQAHLIHDFKSFSGNTPGRYLQSLRDQHSVSSTDERTET